VDAVGSSKAQYTYLTAVNGEIRFEPYGTGSLFEVPPGTTQICYWVRAQRLVSREETLLVSECYSPAELAQFMWQDPDTEGFQAFLRDQCVLPPAGRVAEWCSVFQSALAEGECSSSEFQNVEACESALSICPGGSDGVGASGSDSGRSSGGCAVFTLQGSSPMQGAGAWLTILASLAALRLRRSARLAPREAQDG
jgi:hypothetical protein